MNPIIGVKQDSALVVSVGIRTEPRWFRTVQRKIFTLQADWQVTLQMTASHAHELRVPIGTKSNGASIPYLLRGIINATEIFCAAVLHDHLYGSGEYPRATADRIFRAAIIHLDKRPRWVAFGAWIMVRAFGASHFRK